MQLAGKGGNTRKNETLGDSRGAGSTRSRYELPWVLEDGPKHAAKLFIPLGQVFVLLNREVTAVPGKVQPDLRFSRFAVRIRISKIRMANR